MMRSNLFTIAALLLLGVAFVAAQYQSCGGTSVFKNTPYGVISDHTGATNYSHPQYCIWRILPNSTDDRSQVAIQFDYFDSWGNVSANWFDFLLVKDGPGVNSPDLVWFFGQTVPPVVLSSGNAMTLIWYTYNWPGSNTGKGFQLQFSSSSCPSQCNWQNNQGYCFNGTCNCAGGWRGIACDQPYCANNCGGSARGTCSNGRCQCKPGFYGADCSAPACDRLTVFTDSSVANFSDHHASISGKNEYEHAANCSWLIQPKDAQLIRLKFLSFDLEENWDYVYVYDGPTTDSPHQAFTGSTIPPEFVSTGSSLLLVFVSDTGVASTGFTATYSSGSFFQLSSFPHPSSPLTPNSIHPTVSASSGSSAIGYLATAFVCLLLGAVLGVVSYIYYNKWQEKKSDVHYGVVPTDDGGDLLGDDI